MKMKNKVAAGVVVVGMVASMGSVFAATNAGTQLQGWYNTASAAVKNVIAGDFASYYTAQTTAHATAVGELKGQAQRDIRDAGRAQVASINQSINNQVNEYTGQINTAQAAIASNMPAEYDAVVSATNSDTNTAIAGIGVQNKKDLTNAIKNHKETYLNRLDTEVAPTQTAAVQALNDKISAAKSELSALLAAEQTEATNEIKSNLDNKIAALEAELKVLTDNGVAAAKAEIAAKGAVVLANSLNELDAIVQGIN
ncbi:hypothetical protein [Paenibacillus nasutitermitis]|uniref:Uncharacterized protein n=1 Tax=Paenibacillus nasutitermitis TaxID=1652958 RepID=A0A916ZF62_9BACL|nr:hypothetical protein [Paenibacillus nasutitermitis]GGD91225.1 hypothetical protein GCM10010911_57390 [Paenibacillus nasutitermitis]